MMDRDRAEELADARYLGLYDAERERLNAEWEAEFGPDNRYFPFSPNTAAIHAAIMAQMRRDDE